MWQKLKARCHLPPAQMFAVILQMHFVFSNNVSRRSHSSPRQIPRLSHGGINIY